MSAHRPVGAHVPRVAPTLVTYTTRYRGGGKELERAARTLARELEAEGLDVALVRVESKPAFLEAIARVGAVKGLGALHFVGHGGMYGPMFRTSEHPEQLSPHEWREADIPFVDGAEAFFHTCRSARWFAPFFARTFDVPAWGYHHYTTFSARPDRFVLDTLSRDDHAPLYSFGCAGMRSHGVIGSAKKYLGLQRAEPMQRALPTPPEGDPTYDAVAALYDETFSDIRVREDEWRFVSARVHRGARVLDIGCGNGALLRALAPRLGPSLGVDASAGMIDRAKSHPIEGQVSFTRISGPSLPAEDDAFDIVISLLSWRYLDWDPMLEEIARVLAPGGKLVVVDMVAKPAFPKEWPRMARDIVRTRRTQRQHHAYQQALERMVTDPRWQTMLAYNPIRAEHELVWYFESRFPGRRVETLNVGRHARVMAFDSGPLPGDFDPTAQQRP